MSEESAPNKRKSISDLREELVVAFQQHEASTTNENGDPVVPAKFIASILSAFCIHHDVALLTPAETASLEKVTSTIPDFPITPDELFQFIAVAPVVSASPSSSPDTSFEEGSSEDRGRNQSRMSNPTSRSSSNDSAQTSYYLPSKGRHSDSSIPPSPFEMESRQRSLPLQNAAPTSYRRPTAPGRRRRSSGGSISGGLSDSEVSATPNFGFRARARAPSIPSSPSSANSSFQNISSPTVNSSPDGSSVGVRSPDGSFAFPSSTGRRGSPNQHSPPVPQADFDDGDDSTTSIDRMLDRSIDSDGHDESDVETTSILDGMARTNASSFSSFNSPEERLDALQRVNSELNRRIQENERQFQKKLADMESEMEELQIRLEETKAELVSTRKEEKDLRQKERVGNNQIRSLESSVSKIQKSLDNSKATYQNLHKQYTEQMAESDRTRKALLQKDNDIRELRNGAQAHQAEYARIKGEKDLLESRFADLEQEQAAARELQASLDDQKQENLLLKETINRLRYDIEELSNSATNPATSGNNSRPGTLTKSLANELQSRWRERGEREEHDEDGHRPKANEEDEDEEYIETIITASRRRKVGSRANKGQNQLVLEDELKEYADAYTQHDLMEFSVSSMTQTDPPPAPPAVTSIEVQTMEEPRPMSPVTISVEIQTDEPIPEAGPSGTSSEEPTGDELSSSIETVRPPSPSSSSSAIDSPPSYENIATDEKLRHLQKSHPGLHAGHRAGVPGGIPESVLRDWENVKKEIGFRCIAIDETMKASTVNDGEGSGRAGPRDRIYNIYNTYVLGHGDSGSEADKSRAGLVRDIAMVGLGATVVLAAVGIPAWINLTVSEERRYYLANTVVGQHMDGPHGFGPTGGLYHAVWMVLQRVVHNGIFAARRVPNQPS